MRRNAGKAWSVRPAGSNRLLATLRLLLFLSLAWQGPIPWCHSHGPLATLPSASRTWLADHLQAYHAPSCWALEQSAGWHFHAIFPGAVPGESPQQPSPRIGGFAVPHSGTAEVVELSEELLSGPWGDLPFGLPGERVVFPANDGVGTGPRFLNTAASCRTLLTRLAVLRL